MFAFDLEEANLRRGAVGLVAIVLALVFIALSGTVGTVWYTRQDAVRCYPEGAWVIARTGDGDAHVGRGLLTGPRPSAHWP